MLPDTPEIRQLLRELGHDSHPGASDRSDPVNGYEHSLLVSTGIMEYPHYPSKI